MALYRPTNITPSSFSGLGNGTIDVTKDLQVSWQVEGSSAMTAYQIIIQQNTTESTQVYDSGKVALTDPFFGVDFNGRQQRYTAVIPAASLTALSNGYENGYKLKIKEWWSENDSVEQVQPAFFNTRTTPTLVMDSVASPLNLRRYTFHAAYTQAEGDVLNWFRWYVAEEGHEDAPLKDTGNIYGTGDVRCTYDGFFTGNSYSVRCICETENGIQADTGWVTFNVAYQMSELTGVLEVRKPPAQDALLISWAAIRFINGSADGAYSVNDGILELPDGSSVTWDQVNGAGMRFEPPWSLAWKGKILVNAATLLTIQEDGASLVLSYNNDGFSIKRDGATIFYLPVYICIDDVWTILIEPDRIRFRLDCMAGGLYPSNDLFPSETLYPAAGVMTAFQFEKAWTREQSAFTGVTLHGPQRCDWLWVYAGAFRKEDSREMLYGNGFEPEYSEEAT